MGYVTLEIIDKCVNVHIKDTSILNLSNFPLFYYITVLSFYKINIGF